MTSAVEISAGLIDVDTEHMPVSGLAGLLTRGSSSAAYVPVSLGLLICGSPGIHVRFFALIYLCSGRRCSFSAVPVSLWPCGSALADGCSGFFLLSASACCATAFNVYHVYTPTRYTL